MHLGHESRLTGWRCSFWSRQDGFDEFTSQQPKKHPNLNFLLSSFFTHPGRVMSVSGAESTCIRRPSQRRVQGWNASLLGENQAAGLLHNELYRQTARTGRRLGATTPTVPTLLHYLACNNKTINEEKAPAFMFRPLITLPPNSLLHQQACQFCKGEDNTHGVSDRTQDSDCHLPALIDTFRREQAISRKAMGR